MKRCEPIYRVNYQAGNAEILVEKIAAAEQYKINLYHDAVVLIRNSDGERLSFPMSPKLWEPEETNDRWVRRILVYDFVRECIEKIKES
jgi:hypothetical protein